MAHPLSRDFGEGFDHGRTKAELWEANQGFATVPGNVMAMDDFLTLLDSQEYRWPQDGDLLLRPVSSSSNGARFADHSIARHTFMWDGYMKAAAILADYCRHDNCDKHELVYPILFNYRHGLEVAMKWILDHYGRFVGIREYKKDHNLDELWKLCAVTVTRVCGLGETSVLKSVGALVLEFHKIDESSLLFSLSDFKERKDCRASINLCRPGELKTGHEGSE
jgi:hypothetical protein